jgi:hypothetical protein
VKDDAKLSGVVMPREMEWMSYVMQTWLERWNDVTSVALKLWMRNVYVDVMILLMFDVGNVNVYLQLSESSGHVLMTVIVSIDHYSLDEFRHDVVN